jgi:acetylglutamate kinase
MKILVKLGGTLLDSSASRSRLASQIAAAAAAHATVVVHGGGKQMTRFLTERGVESRFINGLRVTTPETMDAVVKVLAGSVNHELVAALTAAGVRAVGLSGLDSNLTEAEQMDPELGQVGRVVRSNPELLHLLTGNGYLPVVACMAGDRQGRMYNVNADQMAVACAAGFGAEQLIFLTDVDGVLDGAKQVRSRLTVADCGELIAGGIATGGMLAKLNAATSALRQGVSQVRIANGSTPDVLGRLLSGEALGTTLAESS